VRAKIETGRNVCGAKAAFGSMWVANDGSGTLARIDPRTNRVTARIPVGNGACSVTAGFGALWVANYEDDVVLRVDVRGRRVVPVAVSASPEDVVAAFGRLWVTAWEAGELDEIDPRTLRVVRRIDVGPRPVGLAVRRGALWVGLGRDATAIARLDPATGVVERVPVGESSPNLFVDGTADLWVVASGGDLLVRVDPDTKRVRARLPIGRTLGHGAGAPDGTIWVPDKEQNVVYRIDPRGNRVIDTVPAGSGAFAAAKAFGSMWVTSYAGQDVWRFHP
jgi:YVTN family beta-propeller protein